jgi:predicted phage baseplate assembly protein
VLDWWAPADLAGYQADEDSIAWWIAHELTAQPSPDPADWDANPRSIWQDGAGDDRTAFDVFLERAVQKVVPGGWALFERDSTQRAYRITDVGEQTLADFSLTGRATGLDLDTAAAGKDGSLLVRRTTARVQSEALPLAPLPVLDAVQDGSGAAAVGAFAVELDRMVLGLSTGRPVLLTGTTLDDQGNPGLVKSEAAQVAAVVHRGGYTTLYFASRLAHRYVRASLTLTANVARATHGQTVAREILGSGDGSAANQRFTLQRPPLTWVSAPTDTGRRSTLTVRVNDTAWEEVPSLYGLPHDARAYAIRTGTDGSSTVVFGDGLSGARLPSGQSNVAATYRSGIGLAGEVRAGSLSVLMSRPLGVKGVTNPLAANGAADPERLDGARANAPVTVLTLGRIVSLEDYEDFARAFAGVGKAQAVALWDGQSQVVNLTVAAADGTPLDPSSALHGSLTQALRAASDGIERVRIAGFQPRKFRVEGTLTLDPSVEATPVLAAATAALQDAFSFARRGFGQRATSAEVVTVLQSVPGVVACNLTTLVALDGAGGDVGTGVQSVLPAAGAHWENGAIAPAELLSIHPTGVKLGAGART